MIEKLKKNKVAFGLMLPEEREIFRGIGVGHCCCFTGMGWKQAFGDGVNKFNSETTYAIKPNYKPEPEFVDYLIEICEDANCEPGTFLGVKEKLDNSPILPHDHTYLYCLSSLPNFVHFFAATKNCNDKQIILSEHVAGYIYSGKKVYARFRTGGGH